MTDLTELWQKGELPAGWYWVEGSRAEGIYAYAAEYLNNMYRPRNRERIIEKVPSYEEWQASYNCMLENEVLRLKNAKLKELLRECLAHLTIGKYGTSVTPINILCDEVEEVLK